MAVAQQKKYKAAIYVKQEDSHKSIAIFIFIEPSTFVGITDGYKWLYLCFAEV